VANSQTVDVTIRNHRYHFRPAAVVFAVLGVVCLAGAGFLLSWVHRDVVPLVLVASIVLYSGLVSFACRRLPHAVRRIKLGAFLQTFPGGLSHPPSMISDIAFGPDPGEDYAESPLPVRFCQARIAVRNGWRFHLIVSAGDAARLCEWATEKGITVSDSDGYSSPRSST
jgi:hypothetical protein